MSNEVKENEFLNELIDEYGEKVIALAQHLNLTLEIDEGLDEEEKEEAIQEIKDELDNIRESSYDSNLFEYYNEEYNVYTDSEADDAWEDELDNYIDECIRPELPDHLANYFDEEAWKRDARFDGRGHAISRYDGCEYEEKVNDEWYYIFRQN